MVDEKLVLKARKDELDYFREKKVYAQVPRTTCWEKTGKGAIKVKWVDVNKGDELSPNYRSRLVAREMRHLSDAGHVYLLPPSTTRQIPQTPTTRS